MFNKVLFGGRLVSDPQLVITPAGNVVCKLRLACNQRRGNEETTTYMDVVAFKKNAANAQKYLAKGDPILVEGELTTDSFIGKDGVRKKITKIIAHRIQFLGLKKTKKAETNEQQQPETEFDPF